MKMNRKEAREFRESLAGVMRIPTRYLKAPKGGSSAVYFNAIGVKMSFNRRVVLVGQAPSRRSDPARPLSGRSGDFLSTAAGFKIGGAFDLRNLLSGFPGKKGKGDAFPLWKAKIAAWALCRELKGRRVVLLGQNVARAFGFGRPELMTWVAGPWPLWETAVLPHPSGINV